MPYYDFRCDHCDVTEELSLPMARAGERPPCPTCGRERRRLYDTNGGVIIRPVGYSLPLGHPDFWKGFNDPLPRPNANFRGRGRQARPDAEHYAR